MGKKIMLIATLVGVLSLGACVDDKESASVEKIRNAKAEQLSSLAKLNLAEADARALLAAADAALKNAEAELKKIEAEQTKVQVEQAKVQLELDKVKLEQAKADLAYDAEAKKIQLAQLQAALENQQAALENQKLTLEQRKAQVAVDLAGQEQKLEAALLQAQKDLIDAKNSYQASLTSADNAERARLQNLLSTYTQAVTDLNDLKTQLASAQRTLIGLEFELVTAEEVKKTTIAEKENQIAYQKALKEIYENYGADKAGAKTALDKARLELQVLDDALQVSSSKRNEVNTKRNVANTELLNSAYRTKLSNVFAYNTTYGDKTIDEYYDYVNSVWYYGYEVIDKFGITTKVRLYTSGNYTKSTNIERFYDSRSFNYSYNTYRDYYTVQKEGFEGLVAAYETYITEHQETYVNDTQDAYDAAVAAEKVAKTAAEKTDATQAEKDAYVTAHNTTVNCEDNLNNYKRWWNDELENLAKVKETVAYVTGEGQEAVKALVDSYNALSKEYAELQVQYNIDSYIRNLKYSEVTALQNIYDGASNIVTLINNCNTQITQLEKDIATYSAVATKEEAIEAKKIEIANTEAKIALKEKEVADAKTAFEAATADAATGEE